MAWRNAKEEREDLFDAFLSKEYCPPLQFYKDQAIIHVVTHGQHTLREF